jgi:lipoprotein signal peptidase
VKLFESVLKNRRQIVSLFALIFLLIIIDQGTKVLAQKYLENSASVTIVPNLISLRFVRNEIVHIHQYIAYFILGVIVVPALIFYSIAKSLSKLIIIGLALMWAALISNNIVDTFALGYIRDFIKLYGVATGNVADQYRTFGLLTIIAGLLIKEEEKLTPKVILKLFISITILLILIVLYWRYFARNVPI